MMRSRSNGFWSFLSLAVCAACIAAGPEAKPAPSTQPATAPIELNDIAGAVHRPLEMPVGVRATIIIFVSTECPICNAYAAEIGRISAEYRRQGFDFYLADEDADESADAIASHARDFSLPGPLLLDRHHDLARRLGAKITPESVVVSPSSEILYHGRIDDLYFGLARRRFEATRHDLRDALDDIAAGKAVAVRETKTIGCAIGDPGK